MAEWELGLDTWMPFQRQLQWWQSCHADAINRCVRAWECDAVMQSGISPLECDMITADSTFGSLVLCQGLKFTRNTRGPEVSQPAFWRVDQSLATAGSGVPASLPR